MYHNAKSCKAFGQTVALLKLWLRQRGFGSIEAPFSGFLATMLLAWLVSGTAPRPLPRLGGDLGAWELFRGLINFLATHDFAKNPISLCSDASQTTASFSVDEFARVFDVVIVDPTGKFNLAANTTKSDIDHVQHHARQTQAALINDKKHFVEQLMRSISSATLEFDHVLRVPYDAFSSNPELCAELQSSQENKPRYVLIRRLYQALSQGLGDRVKLINVVCTARPSWPVDSTCRLDYPSVCISLLLNPDHARRVIDLGPQAEDSEACQVFRAFWGEKAELRRFKNSSIRECVVWDYTKFEERELIPHRITAYVLSHRFGIPSGDIICASPAILRMLSPPSASAGLKWTPEILKRGFHPAHAEFDKLAKTLRSMSDLPVQITSIQASAAALSYSAVLPAAPIVEGAWCKLPSSARFVEPMNIVIEFEGSSKWPSDLYSVQKFKGMLLGQVGERLCETVDSVSVQLHASPYDYDISGERYYLDILTVDGWAFRARILYDGEGQLLEQEVGQLYGAGRHDERARVSRALVQWRHEYLVKPKHGTFFTGLVHRHPSLSESVRLCKRWTASLMLSNYLDDHLVELLCAEAYLKPAPYSVPSTGVLGFIRFLDHVSRFRFTKTSLKNPDASFRTCNMPPPVILKHLKNLASASLRIVETVFSQEATVDAISSSVQTLFTPDRSVFEHEFALVPQMVTRYFENSRASSKHLVQAQALYKNLPAAADPYAAEIFGSADSAFNKLIAAIGFDTLDCYINDVKAVYGDQFLIFYDKYGGTSVGIVSNPKELCELPFDIKMPFNSQPKGLVRAQKISVVCATRHC